MKTLILNIDDSIFEEIVYSLKSYPNDKLEILADNPTQKDLTEFAQDLRNAFIEIRQMEEGRKQAKTWQDIRNDL